ncbi:cyclic nucleotide-binding domain-containing protein [Rubrivivax rivuli]|uniref:Cyclic nucleotide-binding domain-containing protein n=2 Tax=Rubrivivax rivuli TaxID=1862385 RepID=A0A437REU1_9BURK|nr:SulP family inorganic anion transporter [Rubrivivax rivuli]RVU45297.1 cyclic nucleotide-binding domain-containing protein [Rubrivivax rivuli]
MSASNPEGPAVGLALAWSETRSALAGLLLSLGPALTLGLMAFAALGGGAAALGMPAALLASAVGGAIFALVSRGPVPAAGPSATPVLVVGGLVARVAADPGFDLAQPGAVQVLLALVATAVVTMGVLQVALGLSGLLRFAKFVPQPVLAGFMNGVALLAFLALVPLLLGWPADALHAQGWRDLPAVQPATLAVGLCTVAVILGLPRVAPRLPATATGIAVGCALFALVHLQWPQWPLGPMAGALPPAWPRWDVLAPYAAGTPDALLLRHAAAALTAGLVMALVGTLELVLNSLAMDQTCHTRTPPRREALALGLANIGSGLLGGLPLMFLRPRALRMRSAGGRTRACVLLCCAGFALLGLFATPLLALLPMVVLGAVMAINAGLMADLWSLGLAQQWRRGLRTVDVQLALLVVVLVCAVTVVLGFPAGVAAGALLSLLLFVRTMNRSLVRTQRTAEATPSRRTYLADDEARLQSLRARITVLELEGALFFGSADRVAEQAEALDASCHTLVLDLRRISLIDTSGAVVLSQLARRLADRGIALRLAGVGPGTRHGEMLLPFVGEAFIAAHGAPDTDHAIEAAELQLLRDAGVVPLSQTVPLVESALMAGLDAAQRARLAACFERVTLQHGERLFSHGDPGDRFYVITAGSVDVLGAAPPGAGGPRQRFVSLSPGMMLGETAMLDGQGRSGDAVAHGATEVFMLDGPVLRRLQQEDPPLAACLYRNIAVHLSQRLRAASRAWAASAA